MCTSIDVLEFCWPMLIEKIERSCVLVCVRACVHMAACMYALKSLRLPGQSTHEGGPSSIE